jgi:serine/threonine protein kinase
VSVTHVPGQECHPCDRAHTTSVPSVPLWFSGPPSPCYNGGMRGAAGDDSDRDSLRAAEELRESLFDAFLDAVREGRDEPAAAFLARHGVSDTTLIGRLEAIRGARGSFPAGADPWIGKMLGDFRIDALLGEGGMGIVYRAHDCSLGRDVALKLLRPEVAGAAAAQARFEREARAIARLRHPNIVSLLSIGAADGVRYIAMELVDGRPLDELMAEALTRGDAPATSVAPVATQRVVRWARDIADALACAHAHGIVHRDVKPSNVLITSDDRALLVDFGIARATDLDGRRPVTLTDAFIGSPYAMAPERIGTVRSGALTDDPISDVYGVGILLWECLAGRPPFAAESLERLFQAVLHDEPPRLRTIVPSVSRDIETVTMKAMEKEQARRYPTAAALRDDLDALLAFRPIAARPDGVVGSLLRKAQRHRTLIASVSGAILITAALLLAQAAGVRVEREHAAQQALSEADLHIGQLREAMASTLAVEARHAALAPRRLDRYLTGEEDRELEVLEQDVRAHRADRDAHVDRALELLIAAERLGADPAKSRHLRRALYVAQYEDATRRDDDATAATLKRLVREADPEGAETASLDRGAIIDCQIEPADAAIYLYQVVDERTVVAGGEPRLVPAPFRTPMKLPAGSWAVEVLGNGVALRAGDMLTAIGADTIASLANRDRPTISLAGAQAVTRVEDAGPTSISLDARDRSLPIRLTTRPTPRLASARIAQGETQTTVGDYLLLAEAPGRQTIRCTLHSDRGARLPVRLTLPMADSAPPGFVPIVRLSQPTVTTWMMEREVTIAEYLEFVNDPASLEAIEASKETVIVPRSLVEGVHSQRDESGRYLLPEGWLPDWPALGLSWEDAHAYAAWKTAQGTSRGERWVYEMPTFEEWMQACGHTSGCTYLTGPAWRPKWVASVFANPRATPMSVLSKPRDESLLGVRDLSGSVSEYVDDWWREDANHRRHAGGGWAFGDPGTFEVFAGNGMPPRSPADTVGVRLVVRAKERTP